MRVRAYEEDDLEELRRIHASQGFGYAFPDLNNPLFVTKLVLVEDESNERGIEDEQAHGDGAEESRAPAQKGKGEHIVGAALLRVTAEAYLLLDPKVGAPRKRWEWLLGLHAATERDAMRRGLDDVHAWLPPEIAERFGKRLKKLGWVRDDAWRPYCRRLV